MNKEYQEATNEYLKVYTHILFLCILVLDSGCWMEGVKWGEVVLGDGQKGEGEGTEGLTGQ